MFNKNSNKTKLLLSFLFSVCLSSFAPGPEIGYFNKATQFNKYAYYGVQQFCAYRFATNGVRRLNHIYQQPTYMPARYNMVLPNIFTQARNIDISASATLGGIDPVIGTAVAGTLISGFYSFPIMFVGLIGTVLLIDQKEEREKVELTEDLKNQRKVVQSMKTNLKHLEKDSKLPKEELQFAQDKLNIIDSLEVIERLLLDYKKDSRRELLDLLLKISNEQVLLSDKQKQSEQLKKLIDDVLVGNNNIDLSHVKVPTYREILSNSREAVSSGEIKLNWVDRRAYIIASIKEQQDKLYELKCQIARIRGEIDEDCDHSFHIGAFK